jgi:hypothetical protein
MSLSFLMRWRDAVAESDLSSSAKLTAHTLSTAMSADGECWPGKQWIGRRSSLSERTVYATTRELEAAGFLKVNWSRGQSSHRYTATIAGITRQSLPGNPATAASQPGKSGRLTRQPLPPKALKAKSESGESLLEEWLEEVAS